MTKVDENAFPRAVARYFDDALSLAIARGISWNVVDARARRYDCEPTLFAYIRNAADRVIHADAQQLDDDPERIEFRRMLLHHGDDILRQMRYGDKSVELIAKLKLIDVALGKIKAIFDEAQTPFIALKGAPMGQALFGAPRARQTTDIDIWIRRRDRARARRLLAALGYRRLEKPRTWATNQEIVYHPCFAPVEIHWRMALPALAAPDFDEAYARARRDGHASNGACTLCPRDTWILLLEHAVEHAFALKTRLDIIAFCSRVLQSPDGSVAESILHEHAATYNFRRLSRFAFDFTRFVLNPAKDQSINAKLFGILYQNMRDLWLRDGALAAQLVTGREDKSEAIAGLALRSLLMLAQDSTATGLRSAAKSFFLGPHPFGRFFYLLAQAFDSAE